MRGGKYGSGREAGPGYRSRRLSADRHARRHRASRFILLTGVVLAAIAFIGVLLFMRLRGPHQVTPQSASTTSSGSGNLIITLVGDSGGLSQLAVLARGGGGYSFYVLPARTVTELPGQGFQRLDQLYKRAGQGAVDQGVANLLQVPIQYHLSLGYAALKTALDGTGSVNIKTGGPLSMGAPPGGAPVTLPAGDNPTAADQALALLKTAADDSQDGPQVAAAIWQGLHDALAVKPDDARRQLLKQVISQARSDMGSGDVEDLLAAATTAGTPFSARALPVKAAGDGADWYFEPVPEAIAAMVSGSPQDAGYQVEIQNGTDAKGVVEAAAARLQPLGFSVTEKPDPTGVDFDDTQIRCGSDALKEGSRIHDLLGAGTVIKDDELKARQITVIIGGDLSGGTATGQG